MANFAETQPIEFAKLAPAPVELYGRVGMMKQSMYDANTAKVQGYYDSIAGLDIDRPQDKAYLNERLTQLQTDLGALSGADYSKQSVVNQAGAMAGPASRDPKILQSVMSTAQMRKSDKELEAARRAGKNFPTNDLVYNIDRSRYQANPEVGAPFAAQYVKKTSDPFKLAVDALKAYNPDITEQDIALNPDGTIDGSRLRMKLKNVSPQKIQQILSVALDAGAVQQLQIDGRATYASMDEGDFSSTIFEHTKKSKEAYQDALNTVEAQLTSASGDNHIELEKVKTNLEEAIKQLDERSMKYYDMITKKNLDGAKGLFGQQQFVDRFSTTMAYKEFQRIVVGSDGTDGTGKKKKGEGDDDKDPYGSVPGHVEYTDVNAITMQDYIKGMESSMKMSRQSVVDTYFDPNRTKTKAERDKWYDEQEILFRKGAFTHGNPALYEHFDNQDKRQSKYEVTKKAYDRVVGEAENQFRTSDIDMSGLGNIVASQKGRPNVQDVFTPEDALNLERRAVEYYKSQPQKTNIWNRLWSDVNRQMANAFSDESTKAFVKSLPEGSREKELAKYVTGVYNDASTTILGGNKTISWYEKVRTSKAGGDMTRQMEDRDNWVEDQLKQRYGLGTSLSMNLNPTDAHLKSVKTGVLSVIGEALRNKKDFNQNIVGAETSAEDAKEAAEGEGAVFSLLVVPGHGLTQDKYAVTISSKAQDKQAVVPITEDQKEQWFGRDFEYGTEGRFVKETQERMLMVGNKSTNPAGMSASIPELAEAPYLVQSDFPNVKLFHIRGDVFTGEHPSAVNTVMYVYNPFTDPETGKARGFVKVYLREGGMLDYNTMSQGIKGMTDSKLYAMMNKGKQPTREELEALKNMRR